jgi:hypothetical protein
MDAPTDTDADDGKERIDDREYPDPIDAELEDLFGFYDAGRDESDVDVRVRSAPGDPTTAASIMLTTPMVKFGLSMTAAEAREIGEALIDSADQSDEVVVDHDFEHENPG